MCSGLSDKKTTNPGPADHLPVQLFVGRGWELKGWPSAPHQACVTEFDRLSRREEKLWGEIAKPELGATDVGAEDFLKRLKLRSREEGRLRDYGEDWAGD
jgi:hypothetical protein